MPAPASPAEFVDLVQKSGVVDDARFQSYLKRLTDLGLMPSEPKELAMTMIRDGVLTTFQAEQFLQGKWKRFSIGKYKVLERIGSGGMGQVFLCEHKLMRRRVAVKVLPAAKAQDPASLERFYREARVVAALDHPNLVRAYDIDQDENLHFLVMEYVDGTNLQDLVKKVGPLDPIRAAHYVYGSCIGLQHAHEMSLIHRDIKPGNILIDRSGTVKILDLGLARFFNDTDDALTRKYDESILGTADYLAPEQALDSHTVDIRADIYALGATFYFLLTGQPPFPEGTVAQKLLWHQTREPSPIRSLRPECPQDLANLIGRMMAKDANTRFQLPSAVMEALAPWVQTPIPPPADHELPQLSLAASGGPMTVRPNASSPSLGSAAGYKGPGSMPSNAGSVITGLGSAVKAIQPKPVAPSAAPGAPLSGPWAFPQSSASMATMPTGSGAKAVKPLTPQPAPAPAPVFPTPVAYAPPQVIAPAPVNPPDPFAAPPLHSATSNTGTATITPPAIPGIDSHRADLSADTLPNTPYDTDPPQRHNRRAKSAAPKGRTVLVVGLVIGALLLGGIGVGAAYMLGLTGGGKPVVEQNGPPRWYVAKTGTTTPDATRTLTTLRGAIEVAKSNDVIVLMSDLDEPPLSIAGRRATGSIKSVTIESGSGSKSVTWTPKLGAPASHQALLTLRDLDGWQISGLVLDCNELTGAGMQVSGACPGLSIKNVTIREPEKLGIVMQLLAGDDNRPVKFDHVQIDAKSKLDAAISFQSVVRHTEIENCRFVGPGAIALKIGDGPSKSEAIPQTVVFRNNRIFNFDTGIAFAGPASNNPISLTVANNTFHTIHQAGVRAELRLGSPAREVTFTRNYFAKTKDILVGNEINGIQASDTARDPATKDGRLNPKSNQISEQLPEPNPANDTTFLHTKSIAALANVGAP